jgi:hypothetical protein
MSAGADKGLVELGKGEQKFRTKVVAIIGNFIKDADVEPILKFLVILGLLDVIAISFVITVALFSLIAHLVTREPFYAIEFTMIGVGLFVLLVLICFPLLARAQFAEHGLRTRHDFRKIAQSRSRKRRS